MEIGVIVIFLCLLIVINKYKKTKNKLHIENKVTITDNMLFNGYASMFMFGMFLTGGALMPVVAIYNLIVNKSFESIGGLLIGPGIAFLGYAKLQSLIKYYKSVKNKEYHIIKTTLTEKSYDSEGYYFQFKDYPDYMTVYRNEYISNEEGQEFYVYIFGENVNAKCFSAKYYQLEDESKLVTPPRN